VSGRDRTGWIVVPRSEDDGGSIMEETVDLAVSARIAISDPLPVFRRGIMAALGDIGLSSESPDDLLAWIRQEQRHVVILTLESGDDWMLLAELRRARPDLVVVAVLTDVQAHSYVRAILAGAATAVPRDAPPETIKQVLQAAVAGTSMLPVEVVQVLAASRQADRNSAGFDREQHLSDLSAEEVQWLRELAVGTTVARLAEHAGYSERAMFRLLRDLYSRMQVKSRTEALLRARERGWL
jgi:DNA-binding NarL/FixJ family response regulator